jgi:hypothetical protein
MMRQWEFVWLLNGIVALPNDVCAQTANQASSSPTPTNRDAVCASRRGAACFRLFAAFMQPGRLYLANRTQSGPSLPLLAACHPL